MAKKKETQISIKTYTDLIDEIELAAKDKTRTIDSITKKNVKPLIAAGAAAAGTWVAAAGTIGGAAAGGMLGGTVAGTATAVSLVGGTAAGVVGVGGTTAAGFAAAGAKVGGIAGTPLGGPVGTAIGAGIGAIAGVVSGVFISKFTKKKDEQTKKAATQKLISMQNTLIRQLENEMQELAAVVSKKDAQIKRLEYLIGILRLNGDLTAPGAAN